MGPLRLVILGGTLSLAAALRFAGLGWGLRHLPQQFERVFVQSVWDMVRAGDLDQRCYLYPGLVFYILSAPVFVVQHLGFTIGDAYLGCRAVVACFGVVSVLLTYILGTRIAGERVGLVGALLAAVSPLAVETAHGVRPDVILETFALLAILAFRRLGTALAGDLRAGVALGAATAIKFTGIFLAPTYVAYRLLAPGPRIRRIVLVALLSVLVFFVFTPYGVLAPTRFTGGVHDQWTYHYQSRVDAQTHTGLVVYYLGAVVSLLGPIGAALAVLGLIVIRKEWRSWGPMLLFPVVAIAVFSTANVGGARFLVPAGGMLALVAARFLDNLFVRSAPVAGLLAAVAIGVPLRTSVGYDLKVIRPTPADRALAWIDSHVPNGSRIVTAEKHLGLDRSRWLVRWPASNFWNGDTPSEADQIQARYADLVVAAPSDPLVRGFREVLFLDPELPQAGPAIGLFVPQPRRLVPAGDLHLAASENASMLPNLQHGSDSSGWHTEGHQAPGSWLEIDVEPARPLGRVEMALRNHIGSALKVIVTDDGRTWRDVPFVEESDTRSFPPKQSVLFGPTRVRGVRIEPTSESRSRWFVLELRVEEIPGVEG